MIAAITFDFWDTIAIDDSDEPKRVRLGLPTKAEARVQLFVEHMAQRYPEIPAERVAAAYLQANDRFRKDWHVNHRTPGIHQRLYYAYEGLGLKPAPGQYARLVREVEELAREIETMEVRIGPDFAPDIHWALQILSARYTLGIISDTIHTAGRGIRHMLYTQGLLSYFQFFIFSDEVGASKPSPQVFRLASLEIGLPPEMMVHVGDRESNDVAGPHAIGMRAILYTGIVDRGSERSRANAVCRRHVALPDIVDRLR